MTEEKELSELEKAEKLLKEAEESRQREFATKLNALMEEYGYVLDVQSQLVIKKK